MNAFHPIEAQSLKLYQSRLPYQKYVGVETDYPDFGSSVTKGTEQMGFGSEIRRALSSKPKGVG